MRGCVRWTILLLALSAVCLPGTARASCGLELCPVDIALPAPESQLWLLTTDVAKTDFDLAGIVGDYAQVTQRAAFDRSVLSLGGWATYIDLRTVSGLTESSFVNPVFFAELQKRTASGSRYALGAQLEIAAGAPPTLAADHTELLPYVSLNRRLGGHLLLVRAGYRFSIGAADEVSPGAADHHAPPASGKLGPRHSDVVEGPPLLVNPHTDHELVWRAGLSGTIGRRLRPRLFVDGQTVTDGPLKGQSFVTLEAGLGVPFAGHYQMNGFVQTPLSSGRRLDFRAGLGIAIGI